MKALTVSSDFDTYKAAVANVIPPQKASEIAATAGLTDESGSCPVAGRPFESTRQKGIHVIGDACSAAPMPKSAYAANAQAKVVAAALVDLLNGREPGEPSWINTCYSLVAPEDGIFVSAVYKLGADGKIAAVEGAGGLTSVDSPPEERAREVQYAYSWYNNITHNIFG